MSEKLLKWEGENVHAAREEWQQYINWKGGMIDKCGKVQKRETIAPGWLDTVYKSSQSRRICACAPCAGHILAPGS